MRRTVGVLAVIGNTVPLLAQGAPAQGWAFTWTVASTIRAQSAPGAGMTFDVVVWGGTARITPRAGQPAMRALLGDAGVILAHDGDSVLAVLNHAKRDALLATLGDLAAMGGGPGGLQLTVGAVSSTARPGGAAPPFDGLAVRRITLDQRYTMAVRVQEMQREVQVSDVTTLDLSAALDARGAGFRAFASEFLRALGKPREVRAALRAKEGRLPRGVPVRTRTVTVTVAGGDTLRTETTGTMSSLQRVPVDTMTFRVPAGYRVTEARRLLQSRGSGPT
jgi:hypothetical protein